MSHLDTELLSAYIDAELPPHEVERVKAHLATCTDCRREYEQLGGIATLVRELPIYLPKAPVEIDADAHNNDTGIVPILLEFARPVALAAAIILLALTGLMLVADSGPPPADDLAPFADTDEERADDGGTDPAAGTSQSLQAPDQTAPAMAEAPPDAVGDVAETSLRDAEEAGETGGQAARGPDPAREEPEDSPGFGVTEALVAGVALLIAGAAAWRVRTRRPSF